MWTAIVLVSTGELATASVQNTQVLGNLNHVHAGGLEMVGQQAKDFVVAASSEQLERRSPEEMVRWMEVYG